MSGAPTIHVTWEEFQSLVPAGGGGCYAAQLVSNLRTWARALPLVDGHIHPLHVVSDELLPMLHPHRPEAMPVARVSYQRFDEDLDEDELRERRSVVAWAELPPARTGAP